jgi:hypothetical protein
MHGCAEEVLTEQQIMPSYWPDNKPQKPARRRPRDKFLYRLYLRFGLKSYFWLRHEQNWTSQLAAQFAVTVRLMREGPSNRLARSWTQTTFRCCTLRGVVVSGEGKGPGERPGSGNFQGEERKRTTAVS